MAEAGTEVIEQKKPKCTLKKCCVTENLRDKAIFDSLEIILLKIIASHPEGVHGFNMLKEIYEKLGIKRAISQGNFYPRLYSLQNYGLIERIYSSTSTREKPYVLTEEGETYLELSLETYINGMKAVRTFLTSDSSPKIKDGNIPEIKRESIQEFKRGEVAPAILEYLKTQNNPVQLQEIYTTLGLNKNAATAAIRRLTKKERVENPSHGLYQFKRESVPE